MDQIISSFIFFVSYVISHLIFFFLISILMFYVLYSSASIDPPHHLDLISYPLLY